MKRYEYPNRASWILAVIGAIALLVVALLRDRPAPTSVVPLPEDNVRIERKVMEVTGYSNDYGSIDVPAWRDGFTATMETARVGLCAADWSHYPPGTIFVIPGYGPCEIQDRGGAIKGARLDLFFNTRKEALVWGRKSVEVIVLQGVIDAS